MKINLSDLKKQIAETLQFVGEEIAVDADGTIDLADPTIIWNDLYDLDDQPSFIKYALASINYDLPPTDNEYGMEVDQQTQALLGREKRQKKPVKKTSYGNDSEWAIDRYAKDVSKYPHKIKESLYDNDAYNADEKQRRDMDRAGMLASQNPHFDSKDHLMASQFHASLSKKQQFRAMKAMKKGDGDSAQYHLNKAAGHKETSMGHASAAKLVRAASSSDSKMSEVKNKGKKNK